MRPPSAGAFPAGRDLTTGSIHRAIWFLAPAMALETGILNVSDLLDAYWVSRLGSASMAAVTISFAARWVAQSLSMGLGTGGMAVVSRRVGAKDQEAADHATGQTILLGLAISLLVTVLGLVLARPTLQFLGAGPDVLPLGLIYLRVTFLGSFSWLLVFVINALIRGAGEARWAMRVLFLSVSVIAVSEPVLVLGLGPVPRLGVAGSAGAYVLGFGSGLLLQFFVLIRGRAKIRLRLRHLRPDLPLMGRIVSIALPSVAQMTLRSTSNMVLVALVGTFGTFATAGYGLADRLLLVILVPCFGLGNTACTLVGQNLGAGDPGRAERSAGWVSAYAGGYLLVVTTLLFIFARPLVALFDPTPEVVSIGAVCIRIICLSVVFDGFGVVFGRSLDGAGNTVPAVIINLFTLWGLQLPIAFALSQGLGHGAAALPAVGLAGIWWGRAAANVANGPLFTSWFRKGRWKQRQV